MTVIVIVIAIVIVTVTMTMIMCMCMCSLPRIVSSSNYELFKIFEHQCWRKDKKLACSSRLSFF